MVAVLDPTTPAVMAPIADYESLDESSPAVNGDGRVLEAEAETEAGLAPAPLPPISLTKRLVRGRYRSTGAGYQLELRVDIGGNRPMNRMSGDFFSVGGGTTSFFGSFRVDAP